MSLKTIGALAVMAACAGSTVPAFAQSHYTRSCPSQGFVDQFFGYGPNCVVHRQPAYIVRGEPTYTVPSYGYPAPESSVEVTVSGLNGI